MRFSSKPISLGPTQPLESHMTVSPTSADLSNPAVAYERCLVEPLFRPFAALLLDLTEVAAGDTVLDVACGTGIVARLAAERIGNPRQVTGIDQSRGMLQVAREVDPRIDWREGNASHLPLAEGEAFDVVLCSQALQFFPERGPAVRQMHGALKPAGRLGLTTWSSLTGGFLHDLHLIAERRLGPIVDRRHVFGEALPMRQLLETAGFRNIEIETVTRRVTFPDPGSFLYLNSRALVGMSLRASTLSERSKHQLLEQLVSESADAARVHTTADGLTFPIGSLVATGRR
jgi:ubiquinone/menaquinone biosynthesis C-methylase UbiE